MIFDWEICLWRCGRRPFILTLQEHSVQSNSTPGCKFSMRFEENEAILIKDNIFPISSQFLNLWFP